MSANRVLSVGIFRIFGTVLVGIAIATPASAAILPSFHLDSSVCKATHIVLATEGDIIDGRLRVIESWKGDLEQDTEVVLPELADFADAESRRVRYWGQRPDLPAPYVRAVTGSKIVLFLIKSEPTERASPSAPESFVWLPASHYGSQGGFKVAVAWIEKGEAYAFQQFINPGPSLITHLGTAIEMKAKVAAFVTIETALEKAVSTQDPILATQVLKAYHRQEFYTGTSRAMSALGSMGEAALPMLRGLLNDGTQSHFHPGVLSTMVTAGGASVAPDLIAVIEKELEYWKNHAPELKKGWWNSAPKNERIALQREYFLLMEALRALRRLRYAPCRNVVLAVRDLWQSERALKDLDQMIQECDDVLDRLGNASPSP